MEPSRTSGVAVRSRGAERHLVAAAPFRAGERILTVDGPLVDLPTRLSIQVDDALHVDAPAGDCSNTPWQFLNHSCTPNAVLRGRDLVAWRAIAEDEEVTFDYNSTEYEMATPFVCHCEACGGRRIGGFRALDAEAKEALRPMLAAHLRRRLDGPEA